MNLLVKTLVASIIFIIVQCAPPVVFDQPYPPNENDLSQIPEKYHGVYMCESDSTLVFIDKRIIYAREAYYFEDTIANIEAYEDCTLIDDKLIINETQEEIPIEFVDDNVIRGYFIEQDTLFDITDEVHARTYKQDLIISKAFKEGEYALFILSADANNNIVYRAINEATDLDLFGEITDMTALETDENEPPRYVVSPSLVEFERLFESENIFIECDYLIRIKFEEFTDKYFN